MSDDEKIVNTVKTPIFSPLIYEPVGSYSQAVLVDQILYIAGILGMDPGYQIVCGGAGAQTRQILENMKVILAAGGSSLHGVIKNTIYLSDINDCQVVNQVYAQYFPRNFPTRATFQVAKLPLDAAVEIEAMAVSGDQYFVKEGSCPCARRTIPLVKTDVYPSEQKMAKPEKVTKTIVTSPEIYKPVGPYSQAILVNQTLYISGVLGMNKDAQLVTGGAAAQAKQVLENMKHILEAGGSSMRGVIKTTILLNDINDFQAVNEVYGEYFPRDCPARATFQVGKLPLNAAVEIEAVAISGDLVVAEAGPCPCSRNPQ